MNVLAVVAHPDDEVLGCGGTISRLAEEGHAVSVLLPLRRCDPRGRATWETLLSAFHESCRTLHATPVVPDTVMDETQAEPKVNELHDIVLPFVESADRVLTHWPGDVNQVHRGVARAVEIATRPFRRRRNVSCFEIPTSTDQAFGGQASLAFAPTEYVLLEERHARLKAQAAAAYGGELVRGRRVEDLERRMRVRGAEIGSEFAEAFVVARRFV